jgi:hypothetical protein
MKTQYYKMSFEEIKQVLGENPMSMFPRKYHGPELKCGGPGMCQDCTDRVKNGIPFEFDESPALGDLLEKLKKPTENPPETQNTCTCDGRTLFWHGCQCQPGAKKAFGIKR